MKQEHTIDIMIDFDDDFKLFDNKGFFAKKYKIEAEDNNEDLNQKLIKAIHDDLKISNFSYVSPSKSITYLTDILENCLKDNNLTEDKCISFSGNYEADILLVSSKPVSEKKRRFLTSFKNR